MPADSPRATADDQLAPGDDTEGEMAEGGSGARAPGEARAGAGSPGEGATAWPSPADRGSSPVDVRDARDGDVGPSRSPSPDGADAGAEQDVATTADPIEGTGFTVWPTDGPAPGQGLGPGDGAEAPADRHAAAAPGSPDGPDAHDGTTATFVPPAPIIDPIPTPSDLTVPEVIEPDVTPAHLAPGGPPEDEAEPARPPGRRRGRDRRQRGLRVRERLWAIDPWSVFKVSALFYLCLFLILMVAGTLLWNIGRSSGTIDQAESFVTRLGAYGECVPEDSVPAGTEFENDDDCPDAEVLVDAFALDDGIIFRASLIGGAILVVTGAIGNVLMAVLLNLINEVSGGLRYTVIREPVSRPSDRSPRRRSGR